MPSSLIDPRKKSRNVGEVRRKKMNPLHIKFAREYVANGMVGGAAYRAAYPGCKSANSARVKSHNLLKRADVRDYIQQIIRETDDWHIRRAHLLAKDRRINDFNPLEHLCSFEGGFMVIDQQNIQQVSELVGDCITECEVESTEDDEGNTRIKFRIKLMDKNRAHERERKQHGIDDSSPTVNVILDGNNNVALLEEAEQERKVIDAKAIEKHVEGGG